MNRTGVCKIKPRPSASFTERHGYPVLLENEPIRIAKIPAKAELKDSIIVHPRYVPKGTSHEIIEVEGFRRGRTVDILLEKPLKVDDKKYWILNFKGVGARADCDMVIHFSLFFDDYRGVWGRREHCDEYGRIWGGLKMNDAQFELEMHGIMQKQGIVFVPHIQANKVPADVMQKISEVEKCKMVEQMSQLVRACNTNIRMEDMNSSLSQFNSPSEPVDKWQQANLTAEHIARLDAAIINTQLDFAKKNKMLVMVGSAVENRHIDGAFTDAENYEIKEFERSMSQSLVRRTLMMVEGGFFIKINYTAYRKKLEKLTGLGFYSGSQQHDELVGEAFDKIVKRLAV